MKGLTRVDYKDALNFILDNIEYTYNIKDDRAITSYDIKKLE